MLVAATAKARVSRRAVVLREIMEIEMELSLGFEGWSQTAAEMNRSGAGECAGTAIRRATG
jgi:hypothetical protein